MSDIFFHVGLVLGHTPLWAYGLLALLIVLGVRRLKERKTSLAGLAITPGAFLIWSVWSATVFWIGERSGFSALAWPLALSMGLLSFRWARPSPMRWQEGGLVRAATVMPLLVYVGVFAFRYGLEVWSGFVPERQALTQALAVLVSGFMAGRTVGDFMLAVRLRAQSQA